jgi:hypothetical protein
MMFDVNWCQFTLIFKVNFGSTDSIPEKKTRQQQTNPFSDGDIRVLRESILLIFLVALQINFF